MSCKNVAHAFPSSSANEEVQVEKITMAPQQPPTTPHSQSLNPLLCQECIQQLPHTGSTLCIIFLVTNGSIGISLSENIILKRNLCSFPRQGVFHYFCDTEKRIMHRSSQSQIIWTHLDMVSRLESNIHNPTIQKQRKYLFQKSEGGGVGRNLYNQGDISKQTYVKKGQIHRRGIFLKMSVFKYWGSDHMLSNKPRILQNHAVKYGPTSRVDSFIKPKGVFYKIRVSATTSPGNAPNQT